ncbi:hypothetical protein BDV38DRAFT_232270 [Aspergillus pseudotamarii]|uniref:BTB domain-containing protein n=1 Tax=Aspergillus pseudotamarii TaxID=132259 RepID=A0A5N6TC97_ASPPS|nr:uncharacterized protein BDV38DRAFT_232270 [Aspergillus pseudotamarii]KAE8143897.1 hypothetical protein BDV38DRAFT_232270 [Aspergillus pseudotamarii]
MAKPLTKNTLTAGIARISVGTDDTPFDVHLELLCDHSPYFDDLYADRAQSPVTELPIHFPDDDPDVFSVLISWMYCGQIAVKPQSVLFLIKLWVLAGKFEMVELQNNVISLCKTWIDSKSDTAFDDHTIHYVYSHTLPKSPLRLLVIDTWVRSATKSRFLGSDNLPREFLEELCCALIEWKEGSMESLGHTNTASRYFVPTSPVQDSGREIPRRREVCEIKRLATPDQIRNRKFKRPSPRIRKASPASSLRVMTPISTDTENDSNSQITSGMSSLQV